MQKELEALSEKIPIIEQWAHMFSACIESILPKQCIIILETLCDLQRIFTAIKPFLGENAGPLLMAVSHGEELARQLASYRNVCRRTAIRYLRQRQHIAAYLSLLAKQMREILTVAGYQPTALTPNSVRQQQSHLHMVSNQEKV